MRILLLRNLIDLIDKYNSALRFFYIIICCCQKLGQHTLNIIPDISGFCQRGSIRNRKRNIQKLRKRLDQIGLAASRWSDHQHIGFFNLNIIGICPCRHTLVVIVYRHRDHLFRLLLTDHIFIQTGFNLMGCRYRTYIKFFLCLCLFFRCFLFHLLTFWNHVLQIRQIDHADIRHFGKIHLCIINIAAAHHIHRTLHTFRTNTDILRQTNHLSRLTLRTMTHKTDIFIITFLCILLLVLQFYIFIFNIHVSTILLFSNV